MMDRGICWNSDRNKKCMCDFFFQIKNSRNLNSIDKQLWWVLENKPFCSDVLEISIKVKAVVLTLVVHINIFC